MEPLSPRASWELTWMERFDFVNRANAEYIDRLYEQYQRDPRSIDVTWQAYFAGFEYAAGKVQGGNGKVSAKGTTQGASTPGLSAPTPPADTLVRNELSGNASI